MTEVADSSFDPWTAVPASEFRARQDRVRSAVQEAGLDAAVVYSRGGAFMDMSADVLYLANHYSQQPYIGDEAGIGTARSHGVVVIPVEGPTTVVVDIPWWRRDLVVADVIRPSVDVTAAVTDVLRAAGLGQARLAVAGASYMSAAAWLGLQAALPGAQLVRCDRLVEQLRVIKSPAELAIIRRACQLGNATMEVLVDAVVEGATEAEAVAEAARVLLRGGGVLYDAACASGPNAHWFTLSRLPSADPRRHFHRGDMFHVDCYGSYGGYFFDFARSRVVGDDPTPAQRQLLESVIGVVEATCAAIRPGMTGGDIFAIASEWMTGSEFVSSILPEDQEMDRFPAIGHGLGLMWEAPWLMRDDTTPIEENMYLAVEILLGHPALGGAQFEHNGLVTSDGFEILTSARTRWW
jgi:Xaa-Pro aminopeptidase